MFLASFHSVLERLQYICTVCIWHNERSMKATQLTIDAEFLLSSCNVSIFVQPMNVLLSLPLLSRRCDARETYTCQPPPGTDISTAEYRELGKSYAEVNWLTSGLLSLVVLRCTRMSFVLYVVHLGICPLEPDIL